MGGEGCSLFFHPEVRVCSKSQKNFDMLYVVTFHELPLQVACRNSFCKRFSQHRYYMKFLT